MRPGERARFDRLFEEVLDGLPDSVHELLAECPIVLDDRPSRTLRESLGEELGVESDDLLCGLHTGVPLTERSVESPDASDTIHLFREGIVEMAGGWEETIDEDGQPSGGVERVRDEIRITILHEVGHHFGLDEDDLDRLGYA